MANSPRPGVWSLERSTDHGETWEPWQYFAGNDVECMQFFGMRADDKITSDDQVRSSILSLLDLDKIKRMLLASQYVTLDAMKFGQ